MTICRNHLPRDPFARVDKHLINDASISWKAKGILSYAFSKPDTWKFYQKEIEGHAADGADSLRSGLEELEKAGYLHRRKCNDSETGQFGYEWNWFSRPVSEEEFQKVLPDRGLPHVVNPDAVKPSLVKPETSKNDPLSENDLNKKNDNEAVVVPSCLEKLGISESLAVKLAKQYGDELQRIQDACDAVNEMHPDNLEATIQAALKDSWTPKASPEDVKIVNTEYLDTIRKEDGKTVGPYTVEIGPKYIHFRHSQTDGKRNVSYTTDQKGFIGMIKAFVQKNR